MERSLELVLILLLLLYEIHCKLIPGNKYLHVGNNTAYEAETTLQRSVFSRVHCVALCSITDDCKVALFQLGDDREGDCILKKSLSGNGDEPPDQAKYMAYQNPVPKKLKKVFKNVPKSYKSFKGEYYTFKKEKNYYHFGEASCSKDTAMIAPVFEDKVNEFIRKKVIEYDPVVPVADAWIGLTDRWVEGEWRFSDETLLTDAPDGVKWSEYEPNGATAENCAYAVFNRGVEPYVAYLDAACDSKEAFYICSLLGMENIAKGKTTKQSSNFLQTALFFPDSKYAVDGDYGPFTTIGVATIACTDREAYPWWIVDLEETYSIWGIKLTYNYVGGSRYLHHFEIRVGNEEVDFQSNFLCFYYEEAFPIYSTRLIPCQSEVEGRYTSIQIVQDLDGIPGLNVLILTEVDVYPFPPDEEMTTTKATFFG